MLPQAAQPETEDVQALREALSAKILEVREQSPCEQCMPQSLTEQATSHNACIGDNSDMKISATGQST